MWHIAASMLVIGVMAFGWALCKISAEWTDPEDR